MDAKDQMRLLAVVARTVLDAMGRVGDGFPTATLGCFFPLEVVTEFASATGAEFRETVWVGAGEDPHVIYSAVYRDGPAAVTIQGTRPATPDDVRRLEGARVFRRFEVISTGDALERVAAHTPSSQAEVAP